jgi:hypothetical protein
MLCVKLACLNDKVRGFPSDGIKAITVHDTWSVMDHTIMSSFRGGSVLKLGINNNNKIHGQSVSECRGVYIVEFGFNILVCIIGPI